MYLRNLIPVLLLALIFSCKPNPDSQDATTSTEGFQWQIDQFEDVKILRYQVPGFEQLSLDQKKLAYFLTEAGYAGRDIMYSMNYRHNLEIRKGLEHVAKNFKGNRESEEWMALETYLKRVWFASGIHHHYSMDKFKPGFTRDYLTGIANETGAKFSDEALRAIFDPEFDNKKVNLDESKGLLLGSAVNFYDPDVTQKEVESYYAEKTKNKGERPVSYGLNSKIVRKADGSIDEEVYSANGLYGPAIKKIIYWLEQAKTVAENEKQAKAFDLLIEYYQTGDLKKWDEYNIVWTETKDGDLDYINGFVEVYNDPLGYRGSYENITQITDFEASKQMQVLSENAQWFEDNSTIMDEHKKENVVGVSYKVVNVVGESGDASPSTPIGVNLPNSSWIRAEHGSKSVSLGNIISAYENASGPGLLKEFANDEEEIALNEKYGGLADKLSTALHEVIGHASGVINPGVGTTKETLKSYASALEEARADIVALYFIRDPKIVELGLIPELDASKAEYDGFISNGLMKQLRRIELGKDIEESHMRNRQLISKWAYEMGKDDNVIEMVTGEGKTYININDYDKLREIFGVQLRELQRIKSEGDYDAGKHLVETYGVKVDPALHKEVLDRAAKLKSPPYSGFVNPKLVPVKDASGNITDVKIEYPDSFEEQMMEYAEKYSTL
ncbi:MAG: dihydrofolate reductase [Saprospiraceae bacterium]|nr:dihydrofolate reductase [Saprospiraceae bacterium]